MPYDVARYSERTYPGPRKPVTVGNRPRPEVSWEDYFVIDGRGPLAHAPVSYRFETFAGVAPLTAVSPAGATPNGTKE